MQLARRHPNVRSLVLLAGATDRPGREYLQRTRWLPIFAAAAADDQFDAEALLTMRWFAELSGNPRNRFVGFADAPTPSSFARSSTGMGTRSSRLPRIQLSR